MDELSAYQAWIFLVRGANGFGNHLPPNYLLYNSILSICCAIFCVPITLPPLLSPRGQHHNLRHASIARMGIQVVAEVGATAAAQVQHLSLLSRPPFCKRTSPDFL